MDRRARKRKEEAGLLNLKVKKGRWLAALSDAVKGAEDRAARREQMKR